MHREKRNILHEKRQHQPNRLLWICAKIHCCCLTIITIARNKVIKSHQRFHSIQMHMRAQIETELFVNILQPNYLAALVSCLFISFSVFWIWFRFWFQFWNQFRLEFVYLIDALIYDVSVHWNYNCNSQIRWTILYSNLIKCNGMLCAASKMKHYTELYILMNDFCWFVCVPFISYLCDFKRFLTLMFSTKSQPHINGHILILLENDYIIY